MIQQEIKYRYYWGTTQEELADVIIKYYVGQEGVEFEITVHSGHVIETGVIDKVTSWDGVIKELYYVMEDFVSDFDAGLYNS